MEIEKWNDKVAMIIAWLKENDAGAMGQVIQVNIEAGNAAQTDEDRNRFWEAVRALCKTLPNSPIKKGRGSTLPNEVQAVLDSISDEVAQAASDFFAIGDMNMLLLKHGKSGGGLFTADEYSAYMSQTVVNSLKKRYKEQIWDGSRQGLLTQAFPVEEVDEEE